MIKAKYFRLGYRETSILGDDTYNYYYSRNFMMFTKLYSFHIEGIEDISENIESQPIKENLHMAYRFRNNDPIYFVDNENYHKVTLRHLSNAVFPACKIDNFCLTLETDQKMTKKFKKIHDFTNALSE